MIVTLDGSDWLLAPDPLNIGREDGWFAHPTTEAARVKVPYVTQDISSGHNGVSWYWLSFTAPTNPYPHGRYLLRFWSVHYKADIWMNSCHAGDNEGSQAPFVLDVTGLVNPADNLLAVRVVSPTDEPIDGFVFDEIPHFDYKHSGIEDSVELLLVPPVYIDDVFVRPDPATGEISVRASVHSTLPIPANVMLEFGVGPAVDGETLVVADITREIAPGSTAVEMQLHVDQPHLWDIDDPYLYRVTVKARCKGSESSHDRSVRCGFRDFRFSDGYFRLNGRRVFLRCSHTGGDCPLGRPTPDDAALLRRDLLNIKVMGFNSIRFFWGLSSRYLLDMCDEIGILAYRDSQASWKLMDSPLMRERFERTVLEMIMRDRNHPSVVIWGLLNENFGDAVFRHAVKALPMVRKLDDTRMVLLNSGRLDNLIDEQRQLDVWLAPELSDATATLHQTRSPLTAPGVMYYPGWLGLHPGQGGEYSALRWTAPTGERFTISAIFSAGPPATKGDNFILHNGVPIHQGFIHLNGFSGICSFATSLDVQAGDTIDFAVGLGTGQFAGDVTKLEVRIESETGLVFDAVDQFSAVKNSGGAWSYGYMRPPEAAEKINLVAANVAVLKRQAEIPDSSTFTRFVVHETLLSPPAVGSLSNPGSDVWENLLRDEHTYKAVPHRAPEIKELRTIGEGWSQPVFVSEYGIGSAIDLYRVARQFEQCGAENALGARINRAHLELFLADWEKWRMWETFASPGQYFRDCLAKMAGLRSLGLDIIRSNPHAVGYSLTSTVDPLATGEGLFTLFRELKPGTVDAMFEGLAPLRWCLFVEPVHIYRGSTVQIEAVLANEDALAAGKYPVRLQVVGPNNIMVFDAHIEAEITSEPDGPLAVPVYKGDVVIDGPSGKYRFLAEFEHGATATGGEVEFYVSDPAEMPVVDKEIALWGEDAELESWLARNGVRAKPFLPNSPSRDVILIAAPSGEMTSERVDALCSSIANGSVALFIVPDVLKNDERLMRGLSLSEKGEWKTIGSWVYLKDEWAKTHPIFDGLQSGGLMDYTFYREIIPHVLWSGSSAPDETVAGGIDASLGYSSGLMVAIYRHGAGRVILNTLRIRENLGRDPVAERLLRNILLYAKQVVQDAASGVAGSNMNANGRGSKRL
ncbi:MAG: glycoside hydrolase family 2 protein [Armatimonadota bacterium]